MRKNREATVLLVSQTIQRLSLGVLDHVISLLRQFGMSAGVPVTFDRLL